MILELKRARSILERSGWSGAECEPFCTTPNGHLCWEWDEGVYRYSVQGALIEAHAWPDGWYALERVVAPAHAAERLFVENTPVAELTPEKARAWQRLCRLAVAEPSLDQWLATFGRRTEEVLRAFVLAIQRSKKGERRG